MTLEELEQWFNKPLPQAIQPTNQEKITNVRKFIDAELTVLRANPNNKTFLPSYLRLIKLKSLL